MGGMNTEPGIYLDVPMSEYLALPAMSGSRLEVLRRSPMQYRYSLGEPSRTSPAMERGTALHLAVLEPLLFGARYVRGIEGDGRTKAVKEAREAQAADHPGAIVLPPADYDAVLGMRDAIHAHPRARTLFDGAGAMEVTIIWRDEATGVLCKARPDRLVERVGMHVALKTSRDAAPWAFPRDAENMGYFRSLAFYRAGLRAVGWPYQSTAVLAVESAPPFDLVPYLVEESDLDSAEREVARLLRVKRTCEDTGAWPGYTDGFMTLDRPAWAPREELAA
jgi:hypothetical protein